MVTRVTNGEGGPAYSDAVVTRDGIIFAAGHIPEVDGELRRGSIEEETTTALRGLLATIESAGGTIDTVLKCGCYLADLSDFARFDQAYRDFFGSRFPARTTVGAVLIDGIKVEIDAMAAVAGS
jgi:2-iminobutanoate/2-iminopropanoate deaminase